MCNKHYLNQFDIYDRHNILGELWSQRTGALSTQVLQEFYVNVTRKIASPLSKDSARAVVNSYKIWSVDTTPEEISAAFRIEDGARIGSWDALIVAAALGILLRPHGHQSTLALVSPRDSQTVNHSFAIRDATVGQRQYC